MDFIESGRVKMRPKWRYVLEALLWFFGTLAAVAGTLYLASLIFFVLSHSGMRFLPMFGFPGIMEMLVSFPWLILTGAVCFIILLEIFVRRYSFAWRYPLLYSAIGLLCLAVFGGLIVAQTPLHRNLRQSGGQPLLPPPFGQMRPFYENLDRAGRQAVNIGIISGKTPGGFILQEKRGSAVTVIISANTRLPKKAELNAGDAVAVFGKKIGDAVNAIEIKLINAKDLLMKYFSPWNNNNG